MTLRTWYNPAIRAGVLAGSIVTLAAAPSQAEAEDAKFAFMAPAHTEDLKLFWLNKTTGQMGACNYKAAEDKDAIGTTRCYPAGNGGGPLGPGRYDLKVSNHKTDYSVFRVNVDTGDISICWLKNSKVVCTAPNR